MLQGEQHGDRCNPSRDPVPLLMKVVVWDLDETLVIFNSLVNDEFARENPGCPRAEAFALGEQWQDAILDLSDTCFYYREVGEPRPPHPQLRSPPLSSPVSARGQRHSSGVSYDGSSHLHSLVSPRAQGSPHHSAHP